MKTRTIAAVFVVGFSFVLTTCGSDPAPTPVVTTTTTTTSTTTTSIPAATTLSGTVSAVGGARLAGATVRISDGANAGRSTTTNGSGSYLLENLTRDNANVFARAQDYDEVGSGLFLDGPKTLNFTLRTTAPWTRSGVGDFVFDMPTYISRVRIQASTNTSCQNFAVQIAGRLVVNVIIGTCSVADSRTHDGTYSTSGGRVDITISSGVSWSFTEVR